MEDADLKIAALLKDATTRQRGFELLVARYKRPLYARVRSIVVSHADADDALQNAFINAWNHMDDFKGESALYTWLYRIATNEALMLIRKRKSRPVTDEDNHLHMVSEAETDAPAPEVIAKKLHEALKALPDKQRQVFEMRYFGDMTYTEIADLTQTSVGALKAGYFHAVKKIEKILTR